MSNYGFVYLLTNEAMNCFKVGCTERSPHTRAEELSKPSGVPIPFEVAFYIEVDNFTNVERQIHGWLASHRVNDSREFFWEEGMLGYALRLMYWHPEAMARAIVKDWLDEEHGLSDPENNPFRKKAPPADAPQVADAANDEAAKPAQVGGFD